MDSVQNTNQVSWSLDLCMDQYVYEIQKYVIFEEGNWHAKSFP
jgi:hypothetical protein